MALDTELNRTPDDAALQSLLDSQNLVPLELAQPTERLQHRHMCVRATCSSSLLISFGCSLNAVKVKVPLRKLLHPLNDVGLRVAARVPAWELRE